MGVEHPELRKGLDALMAKTAREREGRQEALESDMQALVQREQGFQELAARLYAEVVGPRLALIREYCGDAEYHTAGSPNAGIVDFNTKRDYSASVQLYLAIVPDASFEAAVIQYRFQILPIFMEFQSDDSLTLPLDAIDEAALAKFVEDKILQSVDAYLRLQKEPQYQRGHMVADPVCRMSIHRAQAIPTKHAGKTYYFCATACRDRFLKEPNRYLA